MPVLAYDRSGSTLLATGTLSTIDNQIDTTTGTVKLRANFSNDQETLFPNQFVNVKLVVETLHDATVIPSAAVQIGSPGPYVYLANPDDTVSMRPVKLGPKDGERVAVLEGLSQGDNVVTDGVDRLQGWRKDQGLRAERRRYANGQYTEAPWQDRVSTARREVAKCSTNSMGYDGDEPLPHFHRSARCHHASDASDSSLGNCRLLAAASFGLAAGRLPDHPGTDFLPRCQPRGDDEFGYCPSRAAIWSDAGAQSNDVHERRRGIDHHAAVRTYLSLDIAEQEVQAAINASGNLLPADLPAPPIYAKVNPADAPVLTIALTSKTMPLTQVQDLAETRLAQKISQLAGVGLVSLSGGHRPAVRVQANMRALAAYGLNIDDLRTSLGNANVNTSKGNFDGPSRAYSINANDQLLSAAAYRDIVIAYRNGAPVRLSDVATVIDGPENTNLAAWANTVPAIIMNIQRQPGANVIRVVDGIKALLPALQAGLPSDVDLAVLSDRTTTIRASVADAQFEFCLAVGLVVLVIFLFLRSLRATLIPSLSVPLSIVGTFGVMYLWGFSFDNLSVMALTIATGFVVDDAIVVIENISRFIEAGEPRWRQP